MEASTICSFCNASEAERQTLIAGLSAIICDQCVGFCRDALEEQELEGEGPDAESKENEEEDEDDPTGDEQPRCSFCGKSKADAGPLVTRDGTSTAPSVSICRDCVDTAREIAEERAGCPREDASSPTPAASDAGSRADRLNDEAVARLQDGESAGALDLLDEALRVDPFHLHAVYNRSLALWRLGRSTDDGAALRLAASARERPEDGRASYLLGLLCAEAGDEEGARGHFADAVRAANGDPSLVAAVESAKATLVPSLRSCHRVELEGDIEAVAVDQHGAVAASAGHRLEVWSIARGVRQRCLEVPHQEARYQTVAMTPDGRRVASTDRKGALLLWDVKSGEILAAALEEGLRWGRVALSADARVAVMTSGGLAWSPLETLSKGKRAAKQALREKGWQSPPRVWNLAVPRRESTLPGHEGAINELALTPDGATVVGVTTEGDLLFWKLPGPAQPLKVRAHEGSVKGLAIDAAAQRALTGGEDDTLRLWDLATGRSCRVLRAHQGGVLAVGLGLSGSAALSVGCDETLRLWDLEDGRCLRTLAGVAAEETRIAVSGGHAITARKKSLSFWGIARPPRSPYVLSHEPVAARPAPAGAIVPGATLEAARAAVAEHDVGRAVERLDALREGCHRSRAPEVLRLWEALSGRAGRGHLRGAWERAVLEGHTGSVVSVDVSPDGLTAVSGARDGTVRVWDVTTGRCTQVLKGHEGPVTCVTLGASGQHVVSGGEDRAARVWEIERGRKTRVLTQGWFSPGHVGAVTCVWASEDGKLVASADEKGFLLLWDVAAGRPLAHVSADGHPLSIRGIGRGAVVVATQSPVSWFMWDPGQASQQRVFDDDGTYVDDHLRAQGGPDVKRLLATRSGTYFHLPWAIKHWKAPPGVPFGSMVAPELAEFPAPALAMTRLGDVAVHTAGPDVAVCDGELGARICVLRGHSGVVLAVALSHDGRAAISGGSDGTVRVWYLEWGVEPRAPADWDERAAPLIDELLRSAAWGAKGPRSPADADVPRLLRELAWAGFGWLRPEGVREHLRRRVRP